MYGEHSIQLSSLRINKSVDIGVLLPGSWLEGPDWPETEAYELVVLTNHKLLTRYFDPW